MSDIESRWDDIRKKTRKLHGRCVVDTQTNTAFTVATTICAVVAAILGLTGHSVFFCLVSALGLWLMRTDRWMLERVARLFEDIRK